LRRAQREAVGLRRTVVGHPHGPHFTRLMSSYRTFGQWWEKPSYFSNLVWIIRDRLLTGPFIFRPSGIRGRHLCVRAFVSYWWIFPDKKKRSHGPLDRGGGRRGGLWKAGRKGMCTTAVSIGAEGRGPTWLLRLWIRRYAGDQVGSTIISIYQSSPRCASEGPAACTQGSLRIGIRVAIVSPLEANDLGRETLRQASAGA